MLEILLVYINARKDSERETGRSYYIVIILKDIHYIYLLYLFIVNNVVL